MDRNSLIHLREFLETALTFIIYKRQRKLLWTLQDERILAQVLVLHTQLIERYSRDPAILILDEDIVEEISTLKITPT